MFAVAAISLTLPGGTQGRTAVRLVIVK